jgi:prepilin-type N-terminal cleavage/methylation domain-containing protein
MFIKRVRAGRRGWTLVEMMVAVGVFSVSSLALGSMFIFSVRSFAAMANYAILDKANRQAMDQITAEIRQAKYVSDYTANPPALTLVNGEGKTVIYGFSAGQMTRTVNGARQMVLTNCTLLQFGLFMRPPTTNATFDLYPVQAGQNWQQLVKVVQLTWKTSLNISPTANVNSENVQTARIVIRKQQDN